MTTDDDFQRVFTPRTLSERWHCSERHVRNMITRGELPSFKLGGKLIRVRKQDVERYEEEQRAHMADELSEKQSDERGGPPLTARQESALAQLAAFPPGEKVGAANLRGCGEITQHELEDMGFIIVERDPKHTAHYYNQIKLTPQGRALAASIKSPRQIADPLTRIRIRQIKASYRNG